VSREAIAFARAVASSVPERARAPKVSRVSTRARVNGNSTQPDRMFADRKERGRARARPRLRRRDACRRGCHVRIFAGLIAVRQRQLDGAREAVPPWCPYLAGRRPAKLDHADRERTQKRPTSEASGQSTR